MYEMVVGIPPYFSSNRSELFENILKAPLKLPRSMSDQCKDLIKSLLCRNPALRLGAQSGADDIKGHPFFADINWDDAINRKLSPPPLEPKRLPLPCFDAPFESDKLVENPRGIESESYIENWSFIQRE